MAADLPDVFLLLLFGKLSPEDRLSASQVCTNWKHRMREANQNLRSLTITVDFRLPDDMCYSSFLEDFTFEYSYSMKQQLMREATVKEIDQKKFEHSTTQWNALQFSYETSTVR